MSDEVILGTGVDIVENERMQELLVRWGCRFKDKVFLAKEQEYCESKAAPYRHYAGRFAVKEAVSKAFGTGLGPHMGWKDIEVARDGATGAPSVVLHRGALKLAGAFNMGKLLISLSHTRNYAIAHALLIGKQGH